MKSDIVYVMQFFKRNTSHNLDLPKKKKPILDYEYSLNPRFFLSNYLSAFYLFEMCIIPTDVVAQFAPILLYKKKLS